MPSLSKHQSNDFVKLLLLGDAKSGKTGSLVSLVEAGYKVRILDFDNLLDILAKLISEQCPEQIDNVEFRSLTIGVCPSYPAQVLASTMAALSTATPKTLSSPCLPCSPRTPSPPT